MWFEWELSYIGSHIWVIGPKRVAWIGEDMEHLGGRVSQEDVLGRLWEFIALPRLQFFLLHTYVCRYGLSASCSGHLLPCLPHHYGLSNSNSYFFELLLVMAFYHQSRKITNREVGTRELSYCWDKSDHVVFGETWKTDTSDKESSWML